LRCLFTLLEAEERHDVSDTTMTYFLSAGEEQREPEKLAGLTKFETFRAAAPARR
jgi:hypothetical protein